MDAFYGLALLVIVIAGVAWAGSYFFRAADQRREAQADAGRQQVQSASYEALIPTSAPNVVTKADEVFYWSQQAAMWRPHAHSEWVGGYNGVSVRVARGIYVRSGGSRGHTVTSTQLEKEDAGTVYVSNLRIAFDGSAGFTEVLFKKIGAVHGFNDGVEILPVNGKPVVFMTGDPRLTIVLGRCISRKTEAQPMPANLADAGDVIKNVTNALNAGGTGRTE